MAVVNLRFCQLCNVLAVLRLSFLLGVVTNVFVVVAFSLITTELISWGIITVNHLMSDDSTQGNRMLFGQTEQYCTADCSRVLANGNILLRVFLEVVN